MTASTNEKLGLGRTRSGTIAPLTGIRGIAALWVVLHHFATTGILHSPLTVSVIAPFLDFGFLGVDLFFVLSGFIISYGYLSDFRQLHWRTLRRFLWLRLARLYPVHIFTLLVTGAQLWVARAMHWTLSNPESFRAGDFVRHVLLVHAWTWPGYLSWNIPAWSISAEWFAYLSFPLLATLIVRIRRVSWLLLGTTLSYAIMLSTMAWMGFSDGSTLYGRGVLVRVIGSFAAGCFLFLLFNLRWGKTVRWSLVSTFAALGVILGIPTLVWLDISPLWIIPLFGVLIFALAHEDGWLAKLLGARPMVFLGEISYSIYMVHYLVVRFLGKVPLRQVLQSQVLVVACYLVIILGVATFTYYLIERPSRNFLRRRYPKTWR